MTSNSYNYGHVPPLLTLGSTVGSAWSQVYAGQSRLPALAGTPPALVVNALGFNDQNSDVTDAVLTETVTTWLDDIRNASECHRHFQTVTLVPLLLFLVCSSRGFPGPAVANVKRGWHHQAFF